MCRVVFGDTMGGMKGECRKKKTVTVTIVTM